MKEQRMTLKDRFSLLKLLALGAVCWPPLLGQVFLIAGRETWVGEVLGCIMAVSLATIASRVMEQGLVERQKLFRAYTAITIVSFSLTFLILRFAY